jgi:VanZ family protein
MTKKIFLWTIVVLYASLIFFVSSIEGSELDTGPPGIDKLLHLIEYLILSFLLYASFTKSSNKIKKGTIFLLSFSISALYGISDEIHQLFVPNRYFELLDILSDGLGSLIGAFWAYKRL